MSFSYLYSAILCLVCSIFVPLLTCFVCCVCCYGRQRANEMHNRIPIANAVIQKLQEKQKLFTELKQEQKTQESCVICCEDFTDDAHISELNCDDRHIFHTECLTHWMREKTSCPLCKREVKIN